MVNKFNNTKAYMRNFSEDVVRFLVKQIERNRQRGNIAAPIDNTGKLKKSFEINFDEDSKSYVYSILGNDYGLIVDEGRGKNKKMPPINEIIQWINTKPVTLQSTRARALKGSIENQKRRLAFAIARKIGLNGTRPTGFVKQSLASAMENLAIEEPIVQDIEENIEEILIRAGFQEIGADRFVLKK